MSRITAPPSARLLTPGPTTTIGCLADLIALTNSDLCALLMSLAEGPRCTYSYVRSAASPINAICKQGGWGFLAPRIVCRCPARKVP
jgi:hypothetical protein